MFTIANLPPPEAIREILPVALDRGCNPIDYIFGLTPETPDDVRQACRTAFERAVGGTARYESTTQEIGSSQAA